MQKKVKKKQMPLSAVTDLGSYSLMNKLLNLEIEEQELQNSERGQLVKQNTSFAESAQYYKGNTIKIYSYNKSHFRFPISHIFLTKNSTRFGQIYCPSSGVLILYTQQQIFFMLVMLPVCLRGQDGNVLTSLADSQHNQHDK